MSINFCCVRPVRRSTWTCLSGKPPTKSTKSCVDSLCAALRGGGKFHPQRRRVFTSAASTRPGGACTLVCAGHQNERKQKRWGETNPSPTAYTTPLLPLWFSGGVRLCSVRRGWATIRWQADDSRLCPCACVCVCVFVCLCACVCVSVCMCVCVCCGFSSAPTCHDSSMMHFDVELVARELHVGWGRACKVVR